MSGTEQKCARCGGMMNASGQCSFCVPSSIGGISNNGADQAPQTQTQVPTHGAMLVNKETNERYPLSQSVSKIGRDKANNISLNNDSYISRHHAWVLFIKGNYFVEDLGSTNGTLLNGEVLSERKQIFPADRIKFGRTELVFEVN
jgi:pSer/pThr/pTyr-binding forkhead associated (FHA) protein